MKNSRWLLPALVAAVSVPALVSCLSVGMFPIQADEPYLAWIGARAAAGLVPYRDYFTMHPPGVIALLAMWFGASAPTLASLRVFQIVVGASGAGLLCRALLDMGLRPALAVASSLGIPLAFFLSWPVPSHHHLAVALGTAALLAAGPTTGGGPGSRRLLLAGVLAGLTGLAVQHAGALVAVWLLIRQGSGEKRLARAAWVSAGVALPLALAAAALGALGALSAAVSDLVVYPLRYYPGGLGNVSLFSSCAGKLAQRWHEARGVEGWAFLGTLALSMALPLLCAWAVGAGAWVGRRREDGMRLAQFGALLFFLGLGWLEWIHTSLWAPFFLLLLAECARESRPGHTVRLFAGWAFALLAACALFWTSLWLRVPPSLARVTEVDGWYTQNGPAKLAQVLPDSASRPPVVCLPFGSTLYLYYAPDRPPLDWLMPPSRKWNAPWEYRALADYCRERKIPYVVLDWAFEKRFLAEPSPVQALLAEEYAPFARTTWGLLMKRKDHAAQLKSPSAQPAP